MNNHERFQRRDSLATATILWNIDPLGVTLMPRCAFKPCRRRGLIHETIPPKRILDLPGLDPLEGLQQFDTDLAPTLPIRAAVERKPLPARPHRDTPDRDQRRRRARRNHLVKLLDLIVANASLLDREAKQPLPNLTHRPRRHRINHVRTVRLHQRDLVSIPPHPDKRRRRELIDLRPRPTIQVQGDAEPLRRGARAMPQHRRIVAPDLRGPGALGRGAVKVFQDQGIDGMHAVVDAGRHHKHHKGICVWRGEAQLRGRPEEQGADVHRGAGFMGRDELGVGGDGELDALQEEILRDGGHGDELCGAAEARGVAVGAEDGDLARWVAEGFEAFVGLLAVVEAGGHAVEGEEGGGDKFGGRPCGPRAVGEVAFHMAVY